MTIRCRMCGREGHNARTCGKRPRPVDAPPAAKSHTRISSSPYVGRLAGERPMNVDPDTARDILDRLDQLRKQTMVTDEPISSLMLSCYLQGARDILAAMKV
jgi:hypothetical protein